MTKSIGWLAIGGIFSFFAAAEAQTLALSTATTAFDGTYALVSSTWGPSVNARCRGARPGPLVTAQGRAEFTNLITAGHFEGTIGSQGELVMRSAAISRSSPGETVVIGRIERDGTVGARMTYDECIYDVVWQKEHK
jgi:hypothetical protein